MRIVKLLSSILLFLSFLIVFPNSIIADPLDSWHLRYSPSKILNAVAYGNGTFIAVGEVILRSDPINCHPHPINTPQTPIDFDGDKKTDIAVYHSASGLWFIKPSSGAADYYVGYGGTDYKPVPGDYDGDGKTDIAAYHSPSGLWFIKPSSGAADYYVGYGGTDYKPVLGNYDGDGKTDIAAYQSPSGLWFIQPSSGAADYYVGYGGTGYTPVNLDYLLGWVY